MRITVLALLGLPACVAQQAEPINRLLPEDTCGAAKVQQHVGQAYEAQNFEGAARKVRVVPPGSVMTMDHLADRLNVDLDETGVVTRLWCG
ncbi:I78 family peptidase inhibitor [uncultured Roseovarius sp.]|uniref:I78 family peptidase inhibitor n=1 Tax=uncultured Roseovarius sp. TaxID=293344 RepID=UPI00262E33F6|nr:I78 family peptidase inhibitor [uncultured Roseovarius sp.]